MTEEEMLAAFDEAGVPNHVSESQAAALARGLGLPWVFKRTGKGWDKWNLAADFARRDRDKERSTT